MAVLGAILNPLSELLYFRDYWRPDSLFGKGNISIEDVIFGASIYALAFVTYPFLTGKKLNSKPRRLAKSQLLSVLLYLGAVGSILLISNLVLGINSVVATGLACTLVTMVIFIKRSDLVLPSIFTSAVFLLVVCAGYALALDVIARIYLKLGGCSGISRWG